MRGPASTIAASLRLMAGRRSIRSSALWTCADSPRTPSTTTRRGGARSRRCTCFRTGTSRAGKATRFRSGSTPTSTRWSCSSTAQSLGSQKVPHLGHVEWKVKYEPGVDRGARLERRQGGADREARDHRPGRGHPADRRPHRDRRRRRRRGRAQGGGARQGRPRRCQRRAT